MKSVKGGIWIIVLIGVSACIEHRPTETRTKNELAETTFIAKKTHKGLRIYEGKIPCADCSGIAQRLVLKGDSTGIYRLTETYQNATEDGDAVLVSTGEWKHYYIDNARSQKRLLLSQGNINDSVRKTTYTVQDGRITQLDLEGKKIDSASHYQLKLVLFQKH
jgi:copper homeostasis protein (lipoprotein)